MTERRLIEIKVETIINNSAATIWDYATVPENWKASMPKDHFTLEYENGRPETGGGFRAKENIGKFPSHIEAHFLYVRRPFILAWTGTASLCLMGGLIKPKFNVNGTIIFDESLLSKIP